DRKMIINALNSGASAFMADFEDSNAPTWANVIEGQVDLRDAVRGTIRFAARKTGRLYTLGPKPAALLVRPRGWHLEEAHLVVDGRPAPASLVDFGLYAFHNAVALVERGAGPWFYLPKLECHEEAALWDDVFVRAQDALGLPVGTIKATVLIETLPAAFEMHEILHALRRHSAGLNCGRWDYIFSYIKTVAHDPARVLPDRAQVGMTQPCMRAYSQLLIQTCHRRGVHAMGGMAAQIPIKSDPALNARALANVRADKLREVQDGHDGTWVAHPGLVGLAREIFDAHMPAAHQIDRLLPDLAVTADDLLAVPTGTRTEEGLRHNIRVAVQYLEAWLGGQGCVPLYHLMEDAATAEIARAQVWQWVRHGARLADGRPVTAALVRQLVAQELSALHVALGDARMAEGRFALAAGLFTELACAETLAPFLTVPAYRHITTLTGGEPMSAHDQTTFNDTRWTGVVRPYGKDQVERLRGTVKIEHSLADRGARRLWAS
ncbi:MAG: malate synthase A, partial [Myxococcales bacterium]|nr:malate synthase A [Myxococcales bacterium]